MFQEVHVCYGGVYCPKCKLYKISMSYTEVFDGSIAISLPTGHAIDIQCASSKELYGKIIKLRTLQPSSISCYLEIFPGLISKEIESMFIVPSSLHKGQYT